LAASMAQRLLQPNRVAIFSLLPRVLAGVVS
jgi:hypothetical protein